MCTISSVTLAAERQSNAIHCRREKSVKQDHERRHESIKTSHALCFYLYLYLYLFLFLFLTEPQDMSKRPEQGACHNRAERNDPHACRLLENEEITIGTHAGAAVEEQELLAARFVRDKQKRRENKLSIFFFPFTKRAKTVEKKRKRT